MKLRIKGNTVRFRLTQQEVARLRETGEIVERTEFDGATLRYGIESVAADAGLDAGFRDGAIAVRVPQSQMRQWADAGEVGLYGRAGAVEIAIEKDFQCLHGDRIRSEADAFPNPHAS